ncbi:MAG TPA: Rrf2 family transcriptional regulator [Mucilaginibacter sp.]|nr:Rrf2 family transcriptional regulator [Mucilaginibacter sp.]
MNGRFPIAVHILTLLSKAGDELLSSDYMAGSININPALARKEISNLRNLGLITSKEGKSGGYSLGKSAKQITLADVYLAIKNQPVLGVAKNTPNPDCPVGKQINKNIDQLYADLDKTLLKKLGSISIEDFSNQFD